VEAVDLELDRLISRRASQNGEVDPDEREALWHASSRAYNARRQEEIRQAWAAYHEGQAASLRRTLEGLISHHTQQAELYANQPNANAKGVA
jgi:hypothetical protein